MNINSKTIASMTEANQNFLRVARIADAYGEAVIFKNNRRYSPEKTLCWPIATLRAIKVVKLPAQIKL